MPSARPPLEAVLVDLDGTLINCSARHYACYSDLSGELGLPCLPAERYWKLKRSRAPWKELFSALQVETDADRFASRFVARIEESRYLRLDSLYPGVERALASLREISAALILVSMRRHPALAQQQLGDLGIAKAFDAISCRGDDDSSTKAAVALRVLPGPPRRLACVGDTEEDIAMARSMGAHAWAVHSGLRDAEYLRAQKPDLLCESLAALAVQIASFSSPIGFVPAQPRTTDR